MDNKMTKRMMVRSILKDHPHYTPAQVNRAMSIVYNTALASGWLQVYCKQERPDKQGGVK